MANIVSVDIDQFILDFLDIGWYDQLIWGNSYIQISFGDIIYVPREVYNITMLNTLFIGSAHNVSSNIKNLRKLTIICLSNITSIHKNLKELKNINYARIFHKNMYFNSCTNSNKNFHIEYKSLLDKLK